MGWPLTGVNWRDRPGTPCPGVVDSKTRQRKEHPSMSEKKSSAETHTAQSTAQKSHGNVRVRRIYDEAQKSDGSRVLVDRVWPRGVSKDKAELDEWVKDVAPSTELRKWYSHDPEKFDEFARRYRKELEDDDASTALDELREFAQKGALTLLTASKRDDISQATVLAEILNDGKKSNGKKGEGTKKSAKKTSSTQSSSKESK
jgi:uncharacterized protein YeaO (DUF488 family)